MVRHAVVWFLSFAFWMLMREFGHEIVQEEGPDRAMTFIQRVRFLAIIGVGAGVIFGSLEYLIDKYIYKKISFGKTILIGSVSYLVAVILLVTFGMRAFTKCWGWR